MTEYKCGSAESCKYGDMCKPNFNISVCSHYKAEEPQTNEEWFCSLPTEEKAEWLSKHFHCGDCIFEKPMCGGEYDGCKSAFVEWLKGEHK